MSRSRPTKTSWSSASDAEPGPSVLGVPGPALPVVELREISLKFVSYSDKQYSLKRSAIDLVLRRDAPPVSNEFWALRDVNLQMFKGERVGILGFNGAGKSTLLRLLARIYTPTRGQMAVRGSVAPLIEMGAGFNPELSGYDNILLNGAMLGIKPRDMKKKVEGIYDFTGLREFADLPLKYYSSGMYAKLAFAIATEVDPEILLIDEALGAGDVIFLDRAKERINQLLERSNLVVIVSHDLISLSKMCTRGIWMHEGQVRVDASISEALHEYLTFARAIEARLAAEAAATAAQSSEYAESA
jgi:ABC-type polysaccharide/polyol phosphate transport system ATPase subunit